MFANFRKNLEMLKRMAIPTKEQRRQLEEAMMMDPNSIQGQNLLKKRRIQESLNNKRQILKGPNPTGSIPPMTRKIQKAQKGY